MTPTFSRQANNSMVTATKQEDPWPVAKHEPWPSPDTRLSDMSATLPNYMKRPQTLVSGPKAGGYRYQARGSVAGRETLTTALARHMVVWHLGHNAKLHGKFHTTKQIHHLQSLSVRRRKIQSCYTPLFCFTCYEGG